jgi:hypothetical protein
MVCGFPTLQYNKEANNGDGGIFNPRKVLKLLYQVGAHNELLIPGNFEVPSGSRENKQTKYLRIRRIYIDQKDSGLLKRFSFAGFHALHL